MDTEYIPFNGDSVIAVTDERTGEKYVSMKHISENIGIGWSNQFKKLKENGRPTDRYRVWGCCDITIPINGIVQTVIVIPLLNINGWLFQINTERVKNLKIKDKLQRYQKECFKVLYDYWNKGQAINPRTNIDLSKINLNEIITNPDSLQKLTEAIFIGDIRATATFVKNLTNTLCDTVSELEKKNEIIDVVFEGREETKTLSQLHKALNVHDAKGNPVSLNKGIQILKDKGIFCKTKNVPYAKYDYKNLFSKIEVPVVGRLGILAYTDYLQQEGYMVYYPKQPQKLIPLIKQKELPEGTTMKETKPERLQPISEEKQEEDSLLEKMESRPMMVPPFQNQTDKCETNIPEGSTIH